ncbi:MAG TPA: hypothetical protein V6C81_26860 [Planktothrix sp.]
MALLCLLCMVVFPLIDLASVGWAAATGYLIATESAGRAAQSDSFERMLYAAAQQASSMSDSGFGRFAHIKPVRGINGSGVDIYIHVTSVSSARSESYGPNFAPPAVDTTSNIYECEARTHFLVYPFINLSAVPFIGKVPLLGEPCQLQFSCLRMVENPLAMADPANIGSPDRHTNHREPPADPVNSSSSLHLAGATL